jgi:alpha-L-arabinofuranosidase
MCEDIGAEPLPVLNCGMACQFNSSELAPMEQLDSYIQDALDLIEFANGPVTSAWGAWRAGMGHPAPFNLKMLAVGNEQWGAQYIERYARFAKALKKRYPAIQLISSAGPGPADDRFHFAWEKLRELNADIIDEHCYAAPQWFIENANRYDKYDRKGPKVFMGEYAAQSVGIAKPENRNTLECAIAEAAFMTGLERNADVVRLASYAPLFGHTDAWQWTPNLIWCDNLRIYGTPNYYVQQLFSRNRGDAVLPASSTSPALCVSSSQDEKSSEVIVKIVNPGSAPVTAKVQLPGFTGARARCEAQVLTGSGPADENSLEQPTRVAPVKSLSDFNPAGTDRVFPPYSFTVLRIARSQ